MALYIRIRHIEIPLTYSTLLVNSLSPGLFSAGFAMWECFHRQLTKAMIGPFWFISFYEIAYYKFFHYDAHNIKVKNSSASGTSNALNDCFP